MDTQAPLALKFAGFHDHRQGHLKVILPVLQQKCPPDFNVWPSTFYQHLGAGRQRMEIGGSLLSG